MVTFETIFGIGGNKIGEKVSSPLSAFNNFLQEIGIDLSKIYNKDLLAVDGLLFDNTGFLILGTIRFEKDIEGKSQFIIKRIVNEENLWLVQLTVEYFDEISEILYRYLFVINDVRKNYDDTVSTKFIETIIKDRKKDKLYLIPFKEKIFKEIENDQTLKNLYDKFTYILNIRPTKDNYLCSIVRVTSSDLNESNDIENLRFLEKEFIDTKEVPFSELHKYLVKLMIYGEF